MQFIRERSTQVYLVKSVGVTNGDGIIANYSKPDPVPLGVFRVNCPWVKGPETRSARERERKVCNRSARTSANNGLREGHLLSLASDISR